jgi:uncharacterized membrane protein|tara:strand:+ start:30491 stop:31027 length:537 start_codon:yes stop_codon:yes gene_type:complete
MFDHPPHPIFVHFTVALTLTGIFCYFIGKIIKRPNLSGDLITSSYWMIFLSTAATIFTIITGFLQFDAVTHDAGSHLAMVNHRNWALGTSTILLIAAIWALINYQKKTSSGIFFPILLIFLLGAVSITAYKGGNLVYKYGLGVKSIPELRELNKESSTGSHENILESSEHEHNHGHAH